MTGIGTDQSEDEILSVEISDEALEAAALPAQAGAYTVAFCSNGNVCPA